jgi:hypothetical protein
VEDFEMYEGRLAVLYFRLCAAIGKLPSKKWLKKERMWVKWDAYVEKRMSASPVLPPYFTTCG